MKKLITILLLSFITLAAQPYTINYSVVIDNCEQNDTYEIFSGSMTEGQSFTFPSASFPANYLQAQFLYNIFVDAEFGIPEGALTEDVSIEINMGNFWCNPTNLPQTDNFTRLLSLHVEITGANSGLNPEAYYWFQDNKEGFITISLTKIAYFLALMNIEDPNAIDVFFVNGDEVDKEAIRKEISGNDFTIYPQHFSLLSAGVPSSTTDVEKLNAEIPSDYNLNQNYPNPFNPTTTINYSIPESAFTKLSIYNIVGEEVHSLINEYQSAGSYNVNFNALDLPSGLYFYNLSSSNFSQTRKMILMK